MSFHLYLPPVCLANNRTGMAVFTHLYLPLLCLTKTESCRYGYFRSPVPACHLSV